ncbi:hypothetical protein J437_LFUL001238 [Ladona fulva]|uniref:Uncharacterized protein n=1 Tax=Ladona fulva TaxID=123851 RepID=A0A8K0JVD6_LADFU|nr:hypothetical protein J437_LFUL001238 [Ladona fulva]
MPEMQTPIVINGAVSLVDAALCIANFINRPMEEEAERTSRRVFDPPKKRKNPPVEGQTKGEKKPKFLERARMYFKHRVPEAPKRLEQFFLRLLTKRGGAITTLAEGGEESEWPVLDLPPEPVLGAENAAEIRHGDERGLPHRRKETANAGDPEAFHRHEKYGTDARCRMFDDLLDEHRVQLASLPPSCRQRHLWDVRHHRNTLFNRLSFGTTHAEDLGEYATAN